MKKKNNLKAFHPCNVIDDESRDIFHERHEKTTQTTHFALGCNVCLTPGTAVRILAL